MAAERELDVWIVPLRRVRPCPEWLEAREAARLARLRVADKRAQFLAAQTALREVLARYLGCGGGEVRFAYGEHGKPFLRAGGAEGDGALGFNLSHSRELALVAVAVGAEVGVDVEYRGRQRPFLRLAKRYFAPPEASLVAALPASEQGRAFYDTWVLKEAYLKAIGTGLTLPPHRFTLDLRQEPPRLQSSARGAGEARRWLLRRLRLPGEYSAAVCYSAPERTIRYRRLEGRRA